MRFSRRSRTARARSCRYSRFEQLEPKLLLASIAFQQGVSGYSGTVDTMTSASNPAVIYSTAGSLNVHGGPDTQGLLRFDNIVGDGAGQIPLASTILSATLELQVTNDGHPVALHAMLQSWSETDTWNSLVNGVQADDVEASVNADATIESVTRGLHQIDVIDRLQSWSDNPAGNMGWVLLPTGSNAVEFDSAEGAMPPRLVVSYGTESLPLVRISATDKIGSEVGPDNGVFTVLRSGAATGDLIVNYTVSGTATPGTDYNSLSGSVTIPDGSVSTSFVVTPIDDGAAEGSETVIATLSTSTAYYLGSSYFDTVTITDNEAALTVSIQAASISEGAGSTTATVRRNSNTTNPLVVSLQSDDLTEAIVPATVTIPAGQTTSPSFNINSVDDRIVDGNQTVRITASETGHRSGSDTLVVTDDDVAGLYESCLDDPGPQVTLGGSQSSSLSYQDVEPNTTFDATDATWYATSTTRIELVGGSNLCWHGGIIEHNWPADQDWETTHGDHGFKFNNTPNIVLEDAQIKTAGDGVSMYEGTEDFLIRGVYMEDIRDDAIEHDWLGSGTIEDTFINGAYVAFAARSRDAVDVDGSDNTWVIKDTLTFLRPQIGVYKGPSPGYGRFFKWEDLGPKLEIHNSIFRADELPDYEFLGIPEGKLVSSSNNIVVWQGVGDPPTLPDGFTLTQDMSVWDNAVLKWKIDHGFLVDESGNKPPVLAAIGAKSVDEGSQLTFTVSATDADLPANTLAFSLDSGAPTGATINPTTGQFRWTPGETDGPGVYAVTVRVVDDGTPSLEDFETFNITVGEFNRAPVLAAIGNKSTNEARLLTFTASATDADLPANNLSFSLDSGAPTGATIDPSSGQFRWTPPEGTSPGNHTVTVRVTDDGVPSLQDFETITITVNDVNLPPVLAAIDAQSVEEGSPLTFTASATDADLPANNLSFSLDAGAPLSATIDSSTGEFRWTPGEAHGSAVFSVTVRVTDDGTPSLEDFETFNITVREVNRAPVLAAIGNKSVDEGRLLTFTASATDADLPANNLTFSLDSGAPSGATIDPKTGQFRWTPLEGTSPGNHTVTVRVTDDGVPSLDDFETVTITVNDVNVSPVLAAIGAQSVEEGSLLTFTASATDADLPANNLSFSLDAGSPLSATIDPSTGEFRWTPGESHGSAVFSVTVRVTDDGTPNLDDFETINITVREVNQAPVLAAIGAEECRRSKAAHFYGLSDRC